MVDVNELVPTDSKSEFHKGIYKTLSLLYLETVKGKVWFIVDGLAGVDEANPLDDRYYFDEHSCPTNYIGCEAIIHAGDTDPHGVFTYVRTIWMPKWYTEDLHNDEETIRKLFPEALSND